MREYEYYDDDSSLEEEYLDFEIKEHNEEDFVPLCNNFDCPNCDKGICLRHDPPIFGVDACRGRI
jgi:hypothetical protein